jgi:VWFA-related protein
MRTRPGILLLVVIASAALSAQAPAPTPVQGGQQPVFRAGANLVRVDMYATQQGVAVEDLRQDEVEVLEDGVPQAIDTFEFVKVQPAGPQETRREPGSVQQMRDMAREARARVFVIFLDTYHTQPEGSANMRTPLVRFLDRILGEDDLVALIAPQMAVTSLTFGRKTQVISDIVNGEWWGQRDTLLKDAKEVLYEACYPPPNRPTIDDRGNVQEGIAAEMIARRRERLTMDSLEALVVHLRGLREERKAVITVTEGWRLFTEDSRLTRVGRRDELPGPPPFGVQGGQVALPTSGGGTLNYTECEADRASLATMDNSRRIIDIGEEASRGNVSFYPVYARGLVSFDSPIGPTFPPSPIQDRATLSARQGSMRDLAAFTDGTAIINTNQIDAALTRIANDLSSYYLFSYYSTNTRLDGRFREITVRVKRPGVQVRARRGYRGMTAAELTGFTPPGGAAGPAASAITVPINPRASFRVRTSGWTTTAGATPTAAAPTAVVWLVGELDAATRRELAWTAGAKADISVVSATGTEIATTSVEIPATDAGFTLRLPVAGGVAPGEYAIRVRVQPAADGALPVSDTVRLIVPAAAAVVGEPLLWRRGPSTGPRFVATADPRFRRSERIRLELPTVSEAAATARMLDRLGRPMQVPVQVTTRADASGQFRWIVAEAVLAPLAAGDYAIEVTLGDSRQVGAFRVIP